MGERLTASDVEKIKKEIEYRKLVVRKSEMCIRDRTTPVWVPL